MIEKVLVALGFMSVLVASVFAITDQSISEDNRNESLYEILTDSSIVKAQLGNFEGITLKTAKSNENRAKGLMFVEKMPENEGMIFVFNDSKVRTFHMGNTLISLDMIFIGEDYKVKTIHSNTKTEQSYEKYSSTEPVMYVIEMNAGWAEKNGIKINDTLEIIEIL